MNINPFLDSNDLKSGMQLFSGINLMLSGVSIVVDFCAVTENSVVFSEWKSEFSPTIAAILLLVDLIIILLQIYLGFGLYNNVMQNTYHKIEKWKTPSIFLLGSRSILIGCYWALMPASTYFYSFTSITLLYSFFMFWPVSRYLADAGCVSTIPLTETSRLINRKY